MSHSHLPGLSVVAAVAMGIGAMCAVMLKLPMTSVLLATLLLFSDGLAVMLAVVVAHVASARISPTGSAAAPPGLGACRGGPARMSEQIDNVRRSSSRASAVARSIRIARRG